jgi:hypothetical protein
MVALLGLIGSEKDREISGQRYGYRQFRTFWDAAKQDNEPARRALMI